MNGMIVGLFAGAVGVGYFMYGKREQKISALVSGALLCIYPYFLSNIFALIAIGVGLVILPFVVEF
ncbi:MAG: hypothetical protein SGJ09_00535 [Phycisphaerae bacterium]|nr:hypothetical protein [Phycisphaerae bacterium]